MEEDHSTPEEKALWEGWTPEEGYEYAAVLHEKDQHGKVDFSDERLPRRSTAPGLHMGLTVLMDVQKDEYFCSGTESVGFKVIPV